MGFAKYSSFFHQLKQASHKVSAIWQKKVTNNKISKFQILICACYAGKMSTLPAKQQLVEIPMAILIKLTLYIQVATNGLYAIQ